MKTVLIGWPGAGLDTIFSALTGQPRPLAGAAESRQGAALVPDERLDYLSGLFKPQKTTPARVDFYLPQTAGEPEEVFKSRLEKAREADALLAVVRNFPAPDGQPPAPFEEAAKLLAELTFNDYLLVEKRLERLAEDQKRGKKGDAEETALLTEARELLEAGRPLRGHPVLPGHPKLRGFGLLSAKPILLVVNNADDDGKRPEAPPEGLAAVAVRGRLEEELARLEPEEAREFLADYGLSALAKDRVLREIYKLMGLLSFFTVGEDECRAWTIKNGATALEAAGAIHSDIKKGFIRAEVISYEDFRAAGGSFPEARKKGTLRLEGKAYLMRDGDIAHFRFNV